MLKRFVSMLESKGLARFSLDGLSQKAGVGFPGKVSWLSPLKIAKDGDLSR